MAKKTKNTKEKAPPSVLDDLAAQPAPKESYKMNLEPVDSPASNTKTPGRRQGPPCKYCNRAMVLARTAPREEGGRVVYYRCDGIDMGRPAWHKIPCGGKCVVMEDADGETMTQVYTRTEWQERAKDRKIVDPRRRI